MSDPETEGDLDPEPEGAVEAGPFPRVSVLLHPQREVRGDLEAALLPALEFLSRRAAVRIDEAAQLGPETLQQIQHLGVELGPRADLIAGADLVITFGGDGSLISAASEVRDPSTCLLGINAGRLGFLTEGALAETAEILRRVFAGEGWLDRRMKLRARVYRGDDAVVDWEAMNDVVVRQGRTNRLLELDARIDGAELITYRADGVVAATPSGSTAYALATGGPIMHPSLEAVVLAPIAPFTLSARALVMPAEGTFELVVQSTNHDATLACDGQRIHPLETGDRIEIRRAPTPATFLRLAKDDYYRILREKLGWHQDRR